jgi:tetratricopeptide (TPR) repeat protein
MRRVTLATLLASAMAACALGAAPAALAAPQQTRDVRSARRATAESIAAQYAAEQFRAAQIGDETTRKLLAQNDAQRRRIAAVLKDAQATAADRDAAKAQLVELDTQLKTVNAQLLASQATGEELKAQLREYERQITEAVDAASPEVAAAYELYAQGDRDTAYEVIDRLSQAEAAAARRAGEIRAGALLRRPAVLALDRKDRGEMTTAQVIDVWSRAQAGDPGYNRGWIDLTNLQMDAGRIADARKSAEEALRSATNDIDKAVASGLIGDTLLAAGDTNGARKRWEDAVAELDKVPASSADHDKAEEGVTALLDRLGDLASAEGDRVLAGRYYAGLLERARRRATAAPDDMRLQRHLVIALAKTADAYDAVEDRPKQKQSIEEMLVISRRVLATGPENLAYQREFAMAEMKLAEFELEHGDRTAAAPLLADGLAVTRRIAAADPTSAVARRDVAVALALSAADAWWKPDGMAVYRSLMQESLAIHRQLVASEPNSNAARQDLASRLYDYAMTLQAGHDLPAARAALVEQVGLYRQAAAAATSYGHDQRRLAGVIAALASVVDEQSGAAAAQPYYDEMMLLRRKLVEENPTSALVHRDLGESLVSIGDSRAYANDWAGAKVAYAEAQTVLEKTLELDSGDAYAYRMLGATHHGLGKAAYHLGQDSEVAREFRMAGLVFDKLADAKPNDSASRRDVWKLAYTWATMVDDRRGWEQALREIEKAKAAGLLDPDDERYLTSARANLARQPAATAPVSVVPTAASPAAAPTPAPPTPTPPTPASRAPASAAPASQDHR